MSFFKEAFRQINRGSMSFWSEPTRDGQLYFLDEVDVKTVKENVKLPGDRVPVTPMEVVEAATNGTGTYRGGDGVSEPVKFIVPRNGETITDITLEIFVGLQKKSPPNT